MSMCITFVICNRCYKKHADWTSMESARNNMFLFVLIIQLILWVWDGKTLVYTPVLDYFTWPLIQQCAVLLLYYWEVLLLRPVLVRQWDWYSYDVTFSVLAREICEDVGQVTMVTAAFRGQTSLLELAMLQLTTQCPLANEVIQYITVQ